MGAMKQIYTEIQDWRAKGRTIEETYVYFKDYIELEDLVNIWEEETV